MIDQGDRPAAGKEARPVVARTTLAQRVEGHVFNLEQREDGNGDGDGDQGRHPHPHGPPCEVEGPGMCEPAPAPPVATRNVEAERLWADIMARTPAAEAPSAPPADRLVAEEGVLREADRLVSTDRQADYKHPYLDYRATGRMWAAYLEKWHASEGRVVVDAATLVEAIANTLTELRARLGFQDGADYGEIARDIVEAALTGVPDLPPHHATQLMVLMKASREAGKHLRDNLVDEAGYVKTTALAQTVEEGEIRTVDLILPR